MIIDTSRIKSGVKNGRWLYWMSYLSSGISFGLLMVVIQAIKHRHIYHTAILEDITGSLYMSFALVALAYAVAYRWVARKSISRDKSIPILIAIVAIALSIFIPVSIGNP